MPLQRDCKFEIEQTATVRQRSMAGAFPVIQKLVATLHQTECDNLAGSCDSPLALF
jgi:hypothetical protein